MLLAWALDAAFGEPRNAWHPVAWLGRALRPLGARLPALAPRPAFALGACAWSGAVVAVGLLAWGVQAWIDGLPGWLALPALALALKPAFAWSMLKDEVRAVEAALGHGLDAGRARLARLCSRDVTTLDATAVRETAVEALAENFNDSLVAPLFWFVVAGLPGAWIWRTANTLDAMWGYRGRWEWAGKWAARADDVLGWIPARLAAALLWSPSVALKPWRDEARQTPSPNGGWPMATMALRLGVRLGKPGVYVLNRTGSSVDGKVVARSLQLAERAARAAFVGAGVALWWRAAR
nr:adenosylcobinamide-phosphate synthase CbiB [Schlegelella koreensis]